MRNIFIVLLVIAVVSAFFLGYSSDLSLRANTPGPIILASNATQQAVLQEEPEVTIVKLKLPAVDKEGNGALADLIVEAREGKGRVFIGFEESPLVNADTQSSLRIALDVAKRIAGNGRDADISYTFSTESDVVGGKSAGAGAAIATIAALKKEKLRSDVLVTGTVEPDGSIGQVGKILEKARVVREAGFKTLLVPVGEGTQNAIVEECKEKRTEQVFVKECFSTVKKVDVAKEVGMKIVEVPNVATAYEYFKIKANPQ